MKKPQIRRKFSSTGDELNYLSDVIRFFVAKDRIKSREASRFLQRFEELLNLSGFDDGSIVLQEHWAFFHELVGNFPKAIGHREREISLIQRALELGGPIGPVNHAFLAREMQALARVFIEQGETRKANRLAGRITELSMKSERNGD